MIVCIGLTYFALWGCMLSFSGVLLCGLLVRGVFSVWVCVVRCRLVFCVCCLSSLVVVL